MLGFPWLVKRKSGIIPGVFDDAAMIAEHVAEHVAGVTRRSAAHAR
jgi:hypothetical protein